VDARQPTAPLGSLGMASTDLDAAFGGVPSVPSSQPTGGGDFDAFGGFGEAAGGTDLPSSGGGFDDFSDFGAPPPAAAPPAAMGGMGDLGLLMPSSAPTPSAAPPAGDDPFGFGGADFATAPAAASGATGGGGGMMDMDFSMLGSPPKAGAAGQSDQVLNSTMVCTLASRVLHPSRLARTPRTYARTRA